MVRKCTDQWRECMIHVLSIGMNGWTCTGYWREWKVFVLSSGVREWDKYWAVACVVGTCNGHWCE